MVNTDVALNPVKPMLPAAQTPSTPALDDEVMVNRWLQIFEGRSPDTHRTYLKESKRWLAFLEFKHGSRYPSLLSRAEEEDVEQYLLALGRPEQHRGSGSEAFKPTTLSNVLLARYKITSQPFAIEHKPRSIGHAVSVLSSLYKFLLKPLRNGETPYVSHNPTSRLVKMQSRSAGKAERNFTPSVYLELLKTTQLLIDAAKNHGDLLRAKRARWVIVLIFNMWLRLSEAASITFGSFNREQGMWFLTVVGKGRKVRNIVVNSEVMTEFESYRNACGLGLVLKPSIADYPAILPTILRKDLNAVRHCDTSTIYRLIKKVGEATATRLEAEGVGLAYEEHSQLIAKIRSISPHWFRHSGASESINSGLPIADTAERLGHTDINTTQQMYFHGDNRKALETLEKIAKARTESTTNFGV